MYIGTFAQSSMPDRFKICTCGKRYTMEEWRKLPRLGFVDVEREVPAEEGEAKIPPFEMRMCSSCGTTVSHTVPYRGGSDYPPPPSSDDDEG